MAHAIEVADSPQSVIWDITYACPLRCTHCYSESGRRPSRQVGHDDMLRIADAIISLRPELITLAGGEPLLVKGIFEVADRLTQAGISVIVYTGGWTFQPWMVDELARVCHRVVVSLDGPTAEIHDRIRGRVGSYARAMNALTLLDAGARRQREQGRRPIEFGIDCVVVRSNATRLDEFCTDIAPRFPELRSMDFGAAIPSGLGSRAGFVEHELLSDEQVAWLAGDEHRRHLQSLAPSTVRIDTTSNVELQMNPTQVRRGLDFQAIQIEPDGQVRAMLIYEGTVGSLLEEPADVLWRRAVARWTDPFITEALSHAGTMRGWAEAVRRIDYHFGSDAVRARIDRRPVFQAPTAG
ncbi:radical SAM protein [Streptomyces sp. CBMA152]|uniref:radical SAM protein n=1 Tax=Streptomyces sp. CBMA152 TaxID=1896312 RepID=UPI002948B9ED|nr:radical SAM protein [Streptomyces sp. CBMA152]